MKPLASLTLLTLWALAQNVYGGEYPSNAPVKCGRRVCVPEAVCRNNNSCRCKSPYIGVGHVKCFNNDSVSCHVIDDPYLKTFCGEKASVPIPCRYRLASLKAGPWCDVAVFVKNYLFLDYLSYATGVEVKVGTQLTIVYDVTPGTPPVAYYKLSSYPKVDLRPGDQVVEAYDVKYYITLDRSDNSLLVNAPLCPLNVLFRPPAGSGAVAEQAKTPGVAITVKRDCIVPNSILGYPGALCAKPSCTDKGLGVYQSKNRLDTGELAALLAWLKSETKQAEGSQCATAMETFNNICSTQALSTQAVNACGPIFSSPIIKCVAKKFDIVELFTRCITAICSKDYRKCSELDNEVKQAKCSVPTLTATCRTIS